MRKIALTLSLLALTAADADAGFRDRLCARFAAPCSSGQCAPAVAFQPAAPVAASPVSPVTYTAPAGTCAGGVCVPVPMYRRFGR